jgi:FAD/FMN-containing dehydrogenase
MNALSTPAEHRYLTHTLWTNSPAASVLAASQAHFVQAPSSKSMQLLSFWNGTEPAALSDCAYSTNGQALLICSALWQHPDDDAVNAGWHQSIVATLDKYAVGHYIGETDIIADPRRAERSYSKASWAHLQELREKYDPDGLFHGFDLRN